MAHVEKRARGRWRARYRTPDGRERSKTFDRRVDADRWLAGVEVSKAAGDWIDPALGKRTFASFAEEWSAGIVDLRPSTLDRDRRIVRCHLLPRFGPVPACSSHRWPPSTPPRRATREGASGGIVRLVTRVPRRRRRLYA